MMSPLPLPIKAEFSEAEELIKKRDEAKTLLDESRAAAGMAVWIEKAVTELAYLREYMKEVEGAISWGVDCVQCAHLLNEVYQLDQVVNAELKKGNENLVAHNQQLVNSLIKHADILMENVDLRHAISNAPDANFSSWDVYDKWLNTDIVKKVRGK